MQKKERDKPQIESSTSLQITDALQVYIDIYMHSLHVL